MEEFTLSEERVNGGFVAHLYNALLPAAVAAGGAGELSFGGDRAAIRIRAPEGAQIKQAAAEAVAEGVCDFGIVVCTTGIGISIAANKVKGVRCALCSEPLSAKMTRLHNDANMLALGGGIVGVSLGLEIVKTFLETPFSEEEKHVRRIGKIAEIEKKYMK